VKSLNNSKFFEDFHTSPLLERHETAIINSGCTGHFMLSNVPCRITAISQNLFRVIFPNDETMDSTHTASLDMPGLSEAASVEHAVTDMENQSLITVGKMCNDGYYFTFRIDGVTI
jgi:hypothetical protein